MATAVSVGDIAAVAVGLVACITDYRSRRIPNWLTFGAATAATVFGGVVNGLPGVGLALGGLVVGCLLFLPWFLLGGMGAGDVKLLAALGAWLGPPLALWTALYAGIAGGIFALAVMVATRHLKEPLTNLWMLLMFWRVAGVQPHPELTLRTATGPRLPYAFPITAGAVAVLWLR